MNKILTYVKKDPGSLQYGSLASQQELIEKLGQIEHRSENLIGEICDYYCTSILGKTHEEAEAICGRCPASKLAEMIGI